MPIARRWDVCTELAGDDKEIVDAIEIYLIQEGYQVVKAYDGEQALEMLRTKKIDLMVIDVMMPKLDGIRATFQARKTAAAFPLSSCLPRQKMRIRFWG